MFMRKEAASLLQLLYANPTQVVEGGALSTWDSEQWALYSALIASLEEAAAHLFAPLWPRRTSLAVTPQTERWLVALLLRGVQHQHGLVRRIAAESALTTSLST